MVQSLPILADLLSTEQVIRYLAKNVDFLANQLHTWLWRGRGVLTGYSQEVDGLEEG